MRSSRHPGPPSTLSGSSSSGRGLVHGSHRDRSISASVFVPDERPSSKKRSKAILILGIALPVLACIIGITAWAVTTDVLRVTPNRFGHRGKTRMDNFQSRNDEDVDVFALHNGSHEGNSSTAIFSPKKTIQTQTVLTRPMSVPAKEASKTQQTSKVPNASDILSKLISDMPIPKNPTNFVVFAPVADTTNEKSDSQARRFDGKVHITGVEDLVAQESVASDYLSQEVIHKRVPVSRKRKSSREAFQHKSIEISPSSSHLNDGRPDSSPNLMKNSNRNDRMGPQPSPYGSAPNMLGGLTEFQNSKIQHNMGPISMIKHNGFKNLPHNVHQNNSPYIPAAISNAVNNQQTQYLLKQGSQAMQASPQMYGSQPKTPVTMQNAHFLPPHAQQTQPFQSSNQRIPSFQTQQHNQQSQVHTSIQPMNAPAPSVSHVHQQHSPNTFTVDNTNIPGGAQYFAPPPQTFHTKVNYETPSKYGSPSSYERVAQKVVTETSKEGHHHHHHHHHHHEPSPMSSDAISEVNLSDTVNKNDADRLGTIGIGLGGGTGSSSGSSPRGITVQIGGGGLTGLLPFNALGIVKNIASALLPRPQMGLNSKVFVGFELGRGRGMVMG